ncbi:MAG: M1 family metallopeptidase, partial [Flavobacteriaceae bacterium]
MKQSVFILLLLLTTLVSGQHQEKVDFIRGEVLIEPLIPEQQINGSVTYEFKILDNVDSVFLDAKNMEFTSVILDSKKAKFTNDGKSISIKNKFRKGISHNITLIYSSKPKQTAYFINKDVIPSVVESLSNITPQVWTQGQGKYTSHWLPSLDDMEEKVEFDLNITANPSLRVIANGSLISSQNISEESKRWKFDMQKPMSSYLLAFVIGDYGKQEIKSKSGVPIENYFYPQDSSRVEPTYRYTKEIFDFLEEEIGVPYPWQNYKQVPVRDFLYAGMENTSCTIFSDGYVIDSTAFIDKNYVNVNAHELAHQWFGNLVTEKDGSSHWLHEGFATYYAQLAEKELFGEDHYYWKLLESLQELQNGVEKGEGQSLLDPKASSLTFYEKGAWALVMLRNAIGDKAFKTGIKSYLNTYQLKNATVDDFMVQMETASGKKLSDFKTEWLDSTSLPYETAKKYLVDKSNSLKLLDALEQDLKAAKSDAVDYQKYWDATNSIHLKIHMLQNYKGTYLFNGLKKAFESDTLPIRQALLLNAPFDDFLPLEQLETFLDDDSYVTQENALFRLWQAYPEQRATYLNKMKATIGLPNKNVRLLWLILVIMTNDYDTRNTQTYFQELSDYSGPNYGWEVRMTAFQYLR